VSNTADGGVQIRTACTDDRKVMLRLGNQDAFDLAVELLASARAAAVRHARDNPIDWDTAKQARLNTPYGY
jgi:hypothetical protein